MEEKEIISARGKVTYWINKQDEGETLCFLPGLSADHTLFEKQIAYFREKQTVLVWDAPAHGKSRPYTDYTYAHLADDLKQILDKENIAHVILIAQSAGGFTAQSLIAKYPAIVKGFFVIGSCPYGNTYYSQSDLFWLKQTRWLFNLYPDQLLRKSIAKMCCTTKEGRENMLAMLNSYDKRELCQLLYLGFASFIPEIQDLKIPCPTELSVGENDRTGKVMKYNQKWHENTGYPLHIIKGAAHNANVDQSDEMNQLIYKFINKIK